MFVSCFGWLFACWSDTERYCCVVMTGNIIVSRVESSVVVFFCIQWNYGSCVGDMQTTTYLVCWDLELHEFSRSTGPGLGSSWDLFGTFVDVGWVWWWLLGCCVAQLPGVGLLSSPPAGTPFVHLWEWV